MRGRSDQPVPLAGQWVVLHRVAQQGGAPVDSMRTDARGRFRFRLTWDTTAIYFVGTEWQDIAYLTQPVQGRAPVDTLETLMVWDTTRTGPPLVLAQRHIVIRLPDADAGRRVLELISLENHGTETRVGTGPTGPTWSVRLPDGAFQFEIGDSDMSADAVREFEGTVQVMAPVPPGERQLLYTYLLPGGDRAFDLTLDQPAARLTVLLEDTSAVLVRGSLTDRGVEVFEDATFRVFDGATSSAGAIHILFSRGRRLSERTLAMLLLAGALGGGLLLLWLRRRPAATADPQLLARQIAALDAAFEARTDASPADRRRYESHRTRIRAALDRALGKAAPPQA